MYFTRESWNVGRLIAIYNIIFSIFLIIFQGKKAQGWYTGHVYLTVSSGHLHTQRFAKNSNYQIYWTTILVFWASLLLITILFMQRHILKRHISQNKPFFCQWQHSVIIIDIVHHLNVLIKMHIFRWRWLSLLQRRGGVECPFVVRPWSDVATTNVCKVDSRYWNTIVTG